MSSSRYSLFRRIGLERLVPTDRKHGQTEHYEFDRYGSFGAFSVLVGADAASTNALKTSKAKGRI
ncbi:hypothetical protein BRC86_07050 [Halobacteriales archaeon QS_3_64_16]|nr:MAG: hypothetical protein BRC86_07050 [Halobacteriales archaeon QS_3_64_16]